MVLHERHEGGIVAAFLDREGAARPEAAALDPHRRIRHLPFDGGQARVKRAEAVYEKARAQGSPRVYWHTHETNKTAMRLYDHVATHSGFVVYRKEL